MNKSVIRTPSSVDKIQSLNKTSFSDFNRNEKHLFCNVTHCHLVFFNRQWAKTFMSLGIERQRQRNSYEFIWENVSSSVLSHRLFIVIIMTICLYRQFDRFDNCRDDRCQQNLSFDKENFHRFLLLQNLFESNLTNVFFVWSFFVVIIDKSTIRLICCRHIAPKSFFIILRIFFS